MKIAQNCIIQKNQGRNFQEMPALALQEDFHINKSNFVPYRFSVSKNTGIIARRGFPVDRLPGKPDRVVAWHHKILEVVTRDFPIYNIYI